MPWLHRHRVRRAETYLFLEQSDCPVIRHLSPDIMDMIQDLDQLRSLYVRVRKRHEDEIQGNLGRERLVSLLLYESPIKDDNCPEPPARTAYIPGWPQCRGDGLGRGVSKRIVCA